MVLIDWQVHWQEWTVEGGPPQDRRTTRLDDPIDAERCRGFENDVGAHQVVAKEHMIGNPTWAGDCGDVHHRIARLQRGDHLGQIEQIDLDPTRALDAGRASRVQDGDLVTASLDELPSDVTTQATASA